MNKKELKKAFDNEFKNIIVSDSLKQKTLNLVNTKKPSRLPYIRNFAAIFVVTLLCISIYFTRNEHFNKETPLNTVAENTNTEISSNKESAVEFGTVQPLYKSIQNEELKSLETTKALNTEDFSASYRVPQQNNTPILTDTAETESKPEFDMTEEEFLNHYPNAEKTEDGYIVYENTKETLYVFKNNILELTLTIHE